MRVKVRKIAPPYTDVPTKSLNTLLYNHAHDKLPVRISTNQLFDIMGVLAERDEAAGRVSKKTPAEALAEFYQHYMPRKDIRKFRVDCLGGYDHGLMELSDVLPASCYGTETIKKYK